MRGGTSKGVFFIREHLPQDRAARDRILLRIIGSPDPYGKQTDGMGGATSSTSKVVLVGPAERKDSDVDYLFGQVSIDKPVIDWSGNCGNLTAAVGPFAIAQGMVKAPADGTATVRIWQANLGARIHAYVPVANGRVVEDGGFYLDGVAFPSEEIRLEFFDQAEVEGALANVVFPTGAPQSKLFVPDVGELDATLISAGNPTIFIAAARLGLRGDEMQGDVNGDSTLLARCETIRAHAAVAMGLARSSAQATNEQPHTPKLAFVARPTPYVASNGRLVGAADMDLNARILSMGKLHHAMTGTGAVAIAVAAAIPGTIVNELMHDTPAGAEDERVEAKVRFGHPSGVTAVSAEAERCGGVWRMTKVSLSRSARTLMEGWVCVPEKYLP
jgi:2-methylaconitate isomerase